jgi:hypothetical protein
MEILLVAGMIGSERLKETYIMTTSGSHEQIVLSLRFSHQRVCIPFQFPLPNPEGRRRRKGSSPRSLHHFAVDPLVGSM